MTLLLSLYGAGWSLATTSIKYHLLGFNRYSTIDNQAVMFEPDTRGTTGTLPPLVKP